MSFLAFMFENIFCEIAAVHSITDVDVKMYFYEYNYNKLIFRIFFFNLSAIMKTLSVWLIIKNFQSIHLTVQDLSVVFVTVDHDILYI